MSFRRYPKYKDSGVDWLGEVPAHWVLRKLGHLATISGGGTPSRERPEFWNGDIPWVSPKDMKTEVISDSEEKVTKAGVLKSTTVVQPSGCVLMVIRSGILQHTIPVGINSAPVALNQDLKSFLFDLEICLPQFFLRWIQGLNDNLLLAWMNEGTTVESFDMLRVAGQVLPLPPLAEQCAIATFLDRETAKIDALIAEQRRLIELLKEKRQAVISHAVTKGLNPNAPMKSSGIDWLGEVPVHWEVMGLTKYLFPVVDYRGRTPTKVDDGVFLLTARNIRDGKVDYEASQEFISADEYETVMSRGKPVKGDVVFTTEAPLGEVANLDREDVAIAQRVIKFRGRPQKVNNYFLKYWIMGSYCQANLQQLATGSTALGIKGSKVGHVRLCLPPIVEQGAIVDYLDRAIVAFDRLTAEAERGIALLQERRTALISAAVTGKIDVRGLAQAEAA